MDESFAESMRKLQEDIKNTEKEVAESLGLLAPPELKRNRQNEDETETRIYKSAKQSQNSSNSDSFPWSNASNFENEVFPGDYCRIVLENPDDQDEEIMPKTTKNSLFPKNSKKNSSDISMEVQWRYFLGDPPSKKFGTKEWIEFQKHKWSIQQELLKPFQLKESLFTKKSKNELDSNLLKEWRCFLGDPPPKKYFGDWIGK